MSLKTTLFSQSALWKDNTTLAFKGSKECQDWPLLLDKRGNLRPCNPLHYKGDLPAADKPS